MRDVLAEEQRRDQVVRVARLARVRPEGKGGQAAGFPQLVQGEEVGVDVVGVEGVCRAPVRESDLFRFWRRERERERGREGRRWSEFFPPFFGCSFRKKKTSTSRRKKHNTKKLSLSLFLLNQQQQQRTSRAWTRRRPCRSPPRASGTGAAAGATPDRASPRRAGRRCCR